MTAAQPIDRVWCVVVPPGYNPDPDEPIASLPEIELVFTGERYEAVYQGFGQADTYKIIYYAHAQGGGVSWPKYGYVTQAGAGERAVLVAGATTNLSLWTNINTMANNAWETLQARQFTTDSVYYLSMETGQAGVDGAVSLEGVGQAITNWAGASRKLTIYLAGEATNELLRLADGQELSAAQLDAWLDAYQQDTNRLVIAVMDFAGAGGFVTNMTTPPDRDRILIAGSGPGEPALCEQQGWLSFSRFFFSYVFGGADVLEAFRAARDTAFNLSRGAQDPQLDDDGDAQPNEKEEGARAGVTYIGSAFVTGAEAPVIGAVTLDTLLEGTNALTLWASEIVAAAGVERVWCVVTPPSDAADPASVSVDLSWSNDTARYEAMYTNFTEPGAYICTFFAMDRDGVIGSPRQAQVLSADRYEPDDSADDARPFEIAGTQVHNIHAAGDEDWIAFILTTNDILEMRTRQLGTNVDTVLDIYFRDRDGVLSNVVHKDVWTTGRGDGESYLLENQPDGVYLARVRAYSPSQAGPGTEYEWSIYPPTAPLQAILSITVQNMHVPSRSPAGAVAHVSSVGNCTFPGQVNEIKIEPINPGTYTVSAWAPGCLPIQHTTQRGRVENINDLVYGNPKRVRVISASSMAFATFQLEPYIQVRGVVRDAWTGKRLKDAFIRFDPASPSGLPCSFYDGYPGYATYRQLWSTAIDGQFPTNVFLPPRAGVLSVSKDGYSNALFVLPALSAGTVTNLGNLYCAPIPTNGGLPARWVHDHFGGPTNITAGEDTDRDGQNNWFELLTDTDPNDRDSVFGIPDDGAVWEEAGWHLHWPGAEAHAYQVAACSNLLDESWAPVAGPWTNWDNSPMEWTSPEPRGRCLYRIEEFRP